MPNLNDREDSSESGALNGTGSSSDTSIGSMKKSDSALTHHSLFAATNQPSNESTRSIHSKSSTSSIDKFLVRQNLLARARHGKFARVFTAKEKLEELMSHVYHVQDIFKEVIFKEIIRLLSLKENQHLLNDFSNIFKSSPLKLALDQNKGGCLNDQIHILLGLGCIPPSDYKLPVKKSLDHEELDQDSADLTSVNSMKMRPRRR